MSIEEFMEKLTDIKSVIEEIAKDDFYDMDKCKDYQEFVQKLWKKEIDVSSILYSVYIDAYDETQRKYLSEK